MRKDGTSMIAFTPDELKVILKEVKMTMFKEPLYTVIPGADELPTYKSIEQKIAIELNIGIVDHEEI